jgi:hypothetical protein
MRSPTSRTVSQRRFSWLLWLALLLPLAQTAAAWHALSHTSVDAGTDADGNKALHATHCDLCLVAAAVSGGALPSSPQGLPVPTARHALVHAAFDSVWFAPPARPYLSRAPPFASH